MLVPRRLLTCVRGWRTSQPSRRANRPSAPRSRPRPCAASQRWGTFHRVADRWGFHLTRAAPIRKTTFTCSTCFEPAPCDEAEDLDNAVCTTADLIRFRAQPFRSGPAQVPM